ncbi:MAG: hypothetical protein JJE23_07600, partial [Thermoleophilia bacterium]|nr:hypothetical protein [Thermoleophilia bacterium]
MAVPGQGEGSEFGAAHGLVILASRGHAPLLWARAGARDDPGALPDSALARRGARLLGQQRRRHDRAGQPRRLRRRSELHNGSCPADPDLRAEVNDRHIFWAGGTGFIGRANLDGTGADPDFIATVPGGADSELALDEGHVYWSSDDWLGRANLDGTGVNQQLLAPQSSDVQGLAVSDTGIYWADYQNSRIGSGELSTLGVNPLFIQPTADRTEGLTVDASHICWSNGSADTVGRANLDGTAIDQSFIPTAYAYGVEVDDSHIFWANYDINSIARANLDGTGVDPAFIGGASGPEGPALDWIVNTGAGLRIVKVKRNRGNGTAKLTVSVPGPGKLSLAGKGLKRVQKGATQAQVRLLARPTGALKRKLAAKGKAKTKARVSFRPKLSTDSKTKAK